MTMQSYFGTQFLFLKLIWGYGMYTKLVNVQSDDCKLYCWSSVYSHRNHQYGKMLIYASVVLCFQRLCK